MRRANFFRAGASIVAALTLVALGGGGGDADEFREEMDAICVDAAEQVGEVIADVGVPQSLEEDAAYQEEILPIGEESLAAQEELEPPESLEADFEDYLANREELLALQEEFIEAATAGDQAAAESNIAEARELGEENREIAADMGLEACAEQLPKREARKVRDLIEETLTTGDPDFCTELYTEQYVEDIGGLEACEESEQDTSNAVDSVEIEDLRGIEQVYAVAKVTPEGGPNDGQPGIIELEYEDGVYKRSALYAAPEEDSEA